jgi:hypothetical protein
MAALAPVDAPSLARYREVVGAAWEILLRRLPDDAQPRFAAKSSGPSGNYRQTLGLLSYKTIEGHQAQLPVIRLEPTTAGRRTAIWIDPRGKTALYEADASIAAPVRALLDGGINVIGVDLLDQGEFLLDGQTKPRQRWLEGEEGFCGWTYCYNLPLVARRVHDILAVAAAEKNQHGTAVDLVAFGPAAAWAAGALVQSPGAIAGAALDAQGFRFADVRDVYDANFLPGAVKYGDLPGLLALAAPTTLWLASERQNPGAQSARQAVQWVLDRRGN